jgi:polyphenol oxidase
MDLNSLKNQSLAIESSQIFPTNLVLSGLTKKNLLHNLDFSQKNLDIFENSKKTLSNFLQIEVNNFAFNKQIHSDKINIIKSNKEFNQNLVGDGFLTNLKNVVLCSVVADCCCVFLYDSIKNVIGCLHSGRIGTQKQIVLKALNLMKSEFDSNPKNIFAYVSSSAGFQNYNVDKQTAKIWPEKFKKQVSKNNSKIKFETTSEFDYLLDIKGYINFQLKSFGLLDENIEISQNCTISDQKNYHSYRREKPKHKLMCGFIMQKNSKNYKQK